MLLLVIVRLVLMRIQHYILTLLAQLLIRRVQSVRQVTIVIINVSIHQDSGHKRKAVFHNQEKSDFKTSVNEVLIIVNVT